MAGLSTCQSDLVFTVLEGSNQGKSLPIKTQKCILAFNDVSGLNHQTRCAIFRGEAGVTLRNLDSRVMVNGELKPVHWLQTGDRIEFPNAVLLEVAQLGSVGMDIANLESAQQFAETLSTSQPADESNEFEFNQQSGVSQESDFEHTSELESALPLPDDSAQDEWVENTACATQSIELSSANDPVDQISALEEEFKSVENTFGEPLGSFDESAFTSDQYTEDQVPPSLESRFHEIEERLNQLADQISSLVTLASCGKFSSSVLPETEWEKHVSSPTDATMDVPLSATSDNASDTTFGNQDSISLDLPTAAPASRPNRFDVSAFGPEPSADDRQHQVAESNFNTVADANPIDSTQSSDSSSGWDEPKFSDNQVEGGLAVGDGLFLVPSRRALDETPSAEFAAENQISSRALPPEIPGFNPELSQLLKSFILPESTDVSGEDNSESASIAIPDETGSLAFSATEPQRADLSSSQLSDPQAEASPTSDLAAKFSALGALDELPLQDSPAPNSGPMAVESTSNRSPSNVEDEIDAMLNRLFDKSNQAVANSTKAAEPILTPDHLAGSSTFVNSASPPPYGLSNQSAELSADNPYASLKFGYELEPISIVQPTPTSSTDSTDELTPPSDNNPIRAIQEPAISAEADMPAQATAPGMDPPSVADLLNRLKQDGCWNDAPETENAPNQNSSAMADASALVASLIAETVGSPADAAETSTESRVAPDKLHPAAPVAAESFPAEPAADSVEDYMSQLLARMNVGAEVPSNHTSTKSKPEQPVSGNPGPVATSNDSELMTEAEYVPRQRAAKPLSFDTMREIANTTARSAVADSDLDRKKARGLMQVVIAFGALIMAGYYLLFVSQAAADTAFFVGAISLLIAGVSSFLAFKTLQGVKKISDILPVKKVD